MVRKYKRIEEKLNDQRAKLKEPKEINYTGIERAIRCIRKNLFAKKLTVRWLKERCRINGGSFATKFAKSTGFYPKEFILYHRIEASKRLLKETDATITVIAVSVAFLILTRLFVKRSRAGRV